MAHTAQLGRAHLSDHKDTIGRVGLAGRGVLYAVISLLAARLAVGSPDGDASPHGAIDWLASEPLGKVLLVVLTGALFALAAWRFLDAAWGDPIEGDEGTDRVRFAAKGVVYLGLASAAASATIASWGGSGSSSGDDGETQREATAVVLGWPLGQWIVGAVGLGVVGYAVFMFKHHTIDETFMERLSTQGDGVRRAGRVGYGARSVVWAVIGVLVVKAAVDHDPNKAGGLSRALQELATTSSGPWLLLLIAFGLAAFGAFCLAEAKHRRAA